jgi:bifunctional UDP-N-acetylglucosamine pyrophosphorylase/glucosamine-1-phosphate N-acetyltransferase
MESYEFECYEQKEQLGTAHALGAALHKKPSGPVLVLNGDVPFVSLDTINKMIEIFTATHSVLLTLGFKAKNPYGYGRMVTYAEDLIDIVEEASATLEQKLIDLCNAGIYLFDHKYVNELLKRIDNNNSKGEYYLTDVVKISNQLGYKCTYHVGSEDELIGVNDKLQLAYAEEVLQNKLREAALKLGVTMIDPKSVFLSVDTVFGRDVVLHPNVIIGGGVEMGDNVEILPFSCIEGTKIGDNSTVGPFARVRSGTELKGGNRIGNFVEVKAAKLGKGVKACHLSYIGDANVGQNTNIGAGTIFCNYDGFAKHVANVGSDVFIGSNSALVAPVNIGSSAIIGAGSTITEDVEEDALSIARARQVNYHQKAELIRSKKRKKSKKPKK